jgi:hypothetical protein
VKAQEASFLVAELTAQKMRSHTIAESLIIPACKMDSDSSGRQRG